MVETVLECKISHRMEARKCTLGREDVLVQASRVLPSDLLPPTGPDLFNFLPPSNTRSWEPRYVSFGQHLGSKQHPSCFITNSYKKSYCSVFILCLNLIIFTTPIRTVLVSRAISCLMYNSLLDLSLCLHPVFPSSEHKFVKGGFFLLSPFLSPSFISPCPHVKIYLWLLLP